MSRPVSLPRAPHAAGSLAEPAAPVWLEWTCLSIVYVVWGSTYLAIRVMVETIPPLLGAGLRFVLAGGLLVGFLVLRRGWAAVRPTNRQLAGCLAMGILLPGANAVVTVAEVDVPSGLAALLIAAVPLILIVMRRVSGEKITRTSTIGVAIGFAGVAILLLPGEKPDGASIAGMLALIGAAAMWANGSFFSAKTDLPKDPFASTGWQMLLGGGVITLAGLLAGEAGDVHTSEWSTRSIAGFVYLVLIGSLIAYSAYVWLLQNAPVSKVATYAYVNPVIAIFLGWIVLSETVTATTLIGAGVIVASVAAVVSAESR